MHLKALTAVKGLSIEIGHVNSAHLLVLKNVLIEERSKEMYCLTNNGLLNSVMPHTCYPQPSLLIPLPLPLFLSGHEADVAGTGWGGLACYPPSFPRAPYSNHH